MLLRCFVGSGNTAHRIKKAYIGDQNGKAQIMYNPVNAYSIEIGSVDSLVESTMNPSTASVGNYALFAGGANQNESYYNAIYYGTTTVTYYSSSLVRGSTSTTKNAQSYGAASIGNYALFGGGMYTSSMGTTYYSTTETFSSSLVHGTTSDVQKTNYNNNSATSGNIYAAIGSYLFDSNLVCFTPTGSYGGWALTHTNSYIMMAGGKSVSYVSNSAFSIKESTRVGQSMTSLSTNCACLISETVGTHGIFAGQCYYKSNGNGGGSYLFGNYTDIYSDSLVKSTISTNIPNKSTCRSCSIHDELAILDGYTDNKAVSYNKNLVAKVIGTINCNSGTSNSGGACALHDYAIFAGGTYTGAHYIEFNTKTTVFKNTIVGYN